MNSDTLQALADDAWMRLANKLEARSAGKSQRRTIQKKGRTLYVIIERAEAADLRRVDALEGGNA